MRWEKQNMWRTEIDRFGWPLWRWGPLRLQEPLSEARAQVGNNTSPGPPEQQPILTRRGRGSRLSGVHRRAFAASGWRKSSSFGSAALWARWDVKGSVDRPAGAAQLDSFSFKTSVLNQTSISSRTSRTRGFRKNDTKQRKVEGKKKFIAFFSLLWLKEPTSTFM